MGADGNSRPQGSVLTGLTGPGVMDVSTTWFFLGNRCSQCWDIGGAEAGTHG